MKAPADAERFYDERVARNRGLIESELQQRLRTTRFVIAGCGSTGGACIGPLVRSGATRFVLADPGEYELANLNRQDATVADIGRNKADVQAERIRSIDPQADVVVVREGMTAANVGTLLAPGDFVVDAVDVTTDDGAAMKVALHRAAHALDLVVVTAYDIGSTQFVETFDYRRGISVLRGKVPARLTSARLLRALVPPWVVPREIMPVLLARRADATMPFPQLAMTAAQFGALIVPIVLRVLAGDPVRRRIRVDLWDVVRTPAERLAEPIRRFPALALLLWRLRERS
jgi:hypothetical protein